MGRSPGHSLENHALENKDETKPPYLDSRGGCPLRVALLTSTRHNRVRHSSRAPRKSHIVGPDDVRAFQYQSYFGSQRSVKPLGSFRILAIARQRSPDK